MKKRITLLLLLLLGCLDVSAHSFLVSFPNHTTAPTQNPKNLVMCNSASLLKVKLIVASEAATRAIITSPLPPSSNYLLGTEAKIVGTPAITITKSGGGANAPNHLLETNCSGFPNLFNLKQPGYEKV
ncbi:MAG: hypothetical protein PHC28_10345 [Flavobacterium sp.]|uniref:hypothetical protein n=1 Tax=Flavobacterium sp. TaxID=239 RepID=UPI0026055A4E|nr:hypothetical protein [Flavobacterium sp.]MDD5150857.1 hypothetical protein [Flavobacterium sp.]